MNTPIYDLILCGAGPANISLLPDLIQNEQIQRCLILEKSSTLGSGEIGQYRITANSLGGVFLEKFQDRTDDLSRFLQGTPEWTYFTERRGEAVELRHVGRFLEHIGTYVSRHKALYKRFEISTQSTVSEIRLTAQGHYCVSYLLDGQRVQATCKKIIFNIGGRLNQATLQHPQHNINSDSLLKGEHDQALQGGKYRNLAIVGSSHSAVSCLIRLVEQLDFPGTITLLTKRDFKLFFDSPASAREQHYPFVDADICQASQRVNRYSGLRYDSFEFARKIKQGLIRNLNIVDIAQASADQILNLIAQSDLLIHSTGYKAGLVPILDVDGTALELQQDDFGLLTNQQLNPVTREGRVLENFHTFGLGAGIKTGGDSGGEESFHGRIDGVWMYQHVVPGLIFVK
ncbi:hypothetical protein [Pseudomonas sp. H1h]|uniref:hypothetical protein n=1 Tax=Pseudomonas sp. H1h TaxID=1397280 RepID=UPI00046A1AE4|nr:hypothetical protein [Pseudomonas sp. H1h]